MECDHSYIFILTLRRRRVETLRRRRFETEKRLAEILREIYAEIKRRVYRDNFTRMFITTMDNMFELWPNFPRIGERDFLLEFVTRQNMQHLIELIPKLQRTEKRDILLEEETRLEELTLQFKESTRQLEENQKRLEESRWPLEELTLQLEESTRQFKENKKQLKESTWQLEKSTRQLKESKERLEVSTWQLEENQKRFRKSIKQLEEKQKRLEESTRQFKENKKQLEESTWQLEENQKRFEESRWQFKENKKRLEELTLQLKENKKRLEESTRQFKENKERLEESTWQLEENQTRLEESRWQFEESTWQLEESTRQLEENKKRLEESTRQLEENKKRLEESTRELEENKKREGTRRLVQPHQGLIGPKYKPRPQLTTSWNLSRALIMMQLFGLCCGATGNTDCLTTQSVLLGSQGIIRCRLFENSTRFFWYDTNNEGGDTALIIMENGRVSGTGYTTGEFNIDNDGSLIINSVTVQHERVFHLESLSPSLIRSTKDITVIVYVEPIEPIPVITECLGKSDCIMKGNLDGVISCVHHNTRPAATISWFMRDGTHDIPLNSTTNHTLSADLITYSVISEMAIGEIPVLVNTQSLVLLVCKSHNPYSVVQESDSKVLLDLSQNDLFEKQPDLPGDPVYAIQNQDLVLECPLPIAAEDSIVMWMTKSLETRNSVYLIYSAYSVFPSVDTNKQLSFDKSGDLVISQVGLQHKGMYACVKSTRNTTKSLLQHVEIIVQPTPPKVLVEGCELFQPCSFHITKTKTITCKVNGIHPKVELMIKALSTNLAVIKTEVSTNKEEGLFYTSIHGDVIVVDASCQENGTIICQAVGTAANVFKSDVYITILSHGEKCPQTSAAPFPAEEAEQTSTAQITIMTAGFYFILLCIVIIFIWLCVGQRKHFEHMQAVQVTELNSM